jgi:hypothetical protein
VAIREPKPATLKRYGMTMDDWRAMLEAQGGVCFICQREPKSGRLCVDHEHVRGWKALPAEKRRLYVRGLCCWMCNHYYLGRGITVDKAKRVVEYLTQYLARRPAA